MSMDENYDILNPGEVYKRQAIWYSKLNDWENALSNYEARFEKKEHDVNWQIEQMK